MTLRSTHFSEVDIVRWISVLVIARIYGYPSPSIQAYPSTRIVKDSDIHVSGYSNLDPSIRISEPGSISLDDISHTKCFLSGCYDRCFSLSVFIFPISSVSFLSCRVRLSLSSSPLEPSPFVLSRRYSLGRKRAKCQIQKRGRCHA